MRIVLDTSVLVAGLLSPSGGSGVVLDHVLAGSVAVLFDDRILDEYREVLARPEFAKLDREDVAEVVVALVLQGERVAVTAFADTLKDEKDRPFIEVAIAGKADAVLTHNPTDFTQPPDLPVMRPGEWIQKVVPWLKPLPSG